MTPELLERLAAEFLSQSLPKEQWTHGAHLCVGAWHVHGFGADDAIVLLREGIVALNRSHGTPNTETSGYHETITVAYVRLIDQFLSHFDPSVSLASRVMRLVAGPLSERSFLFRFWSPDVLMSPAARADWVPPDRAPLSLPSDAVPPKSGLG